MNADEKTCPRCAETIKRAALVCRYCGHEFGEVPPPGTPPEEHAAAAPPSRWLPPKSNTPDDPSASDAGDWRGQLRKVAGFGCLGFLGLAFLGAIIGGGSDGSNTAVLEDTNEALPINAFETASAQASEEAPASDWHMRTQQDELRGKQIHYASVTSTNSARFDFPYAGGSSLTMTVRRHPKWGDDVIFEISKGQFVCRIDNCRGTINYGSGPVSLNLAEPADHSSDTLFAENASGVIARLKKADRVIVELPFFQEGNHQFTFNTKGLAWPPKSNS